MTIKEVTATIIKWIKSCDRIEQLEGLEQSAPKIIDCLFDKVESELTVELTKAGLLTVIEIQKTAINDAYETITR